MNKVSAEKNNVGPEKQSTLSETYPNSDLT